MKDKAKHVQPAMQNHTGMIYYCLYICKLCGIYFCSINATIYISFNYLDNISFYVSTIDICGLILLCLIYMYL